MRFKKANEFITDYIILLPITISNNINVPILNILLICISVPYSIFLILPCAIAITILSIMEYLFDSLEERRKHKNKPETVINP